MSRVLLLLLVVVVVFFSFNRHNLKTVRGIYKAVTLRTMIEYVNPACNVMRGINISFLHLYSSIVFDGAFGTAKMGKTFLLNEGGYRDGKL